MREQFEKLPRVKPILRLVNYSESSDGYDPLYQKSIYEKYADWLNGAWYAYQKQQKKIDAITKQRDSFIKSHRIAMNDVCENKAKIDELQARIDDALNTLCKLQYSSGERIYNDVGSILKGNKDENY